MSNTENKSIKQAVTQYLTQELLSGENRKFFLEENEEKQADILYALSRKLSYKIFKDCSLACEYHYKKGILSLSYRVTNKDNEELWKGQIADNITGHENAGIKKRIEAEIFSEILEMPPAKAEKVFSSISGKSLIEVMKDYKNRQSLVSFLSNLFNNTIKAGNRTYQ